MKKIVLLSLLSTALMTAFAQPHLQATSAKDRMEGEARRKKLEEQSLIGNIPFRNVGPTIMSGRVNDLVANPDKPSEFYVAYASGGLWYTKNNGQSFTCISDNLPHTFAGAVSVNWKERIVWLGTGEPNALRSSYAGTGIYKTRDNGKNWEYLGLPESHRIGKIELHPTNPDIAWVAAMGHLYSFNKERGVYMTADGGKTWSQALYIDDKTGAIDIVVDPKNPNNVYAAMWHKVRTAWNLDEHGQTSGIHKSTDGGKTWKLISTAASGFPHKEFTGRIGLAIYPQQPNILYAVVDNNEPRPDTSVRRQPDTVYALKDFKGITKEQFAALDDKKFAGFLRQNGLGQHKPSDIKEKVANGTFKPTVITDYFGEGGDAIESILNTPIIGAEVYRSDDGGATWKKTHKNYMDNMFFTYGYVFARIWVSPINPDKIVTIAVPLMMSTDAGKTWTSIGKENVHVDHHAFWFNPKDDEHFINGNDGGVNISYDNGETWFKANTPAVSQFYSIAIDQQKPYNVYGGMQDNGVWYGPSNYEASHRWFANGQYPYKSIGGGDGMQVQVDWRDNVTYYTGSQFGSYYRNSTDGSSRRIGIRPTHQLGDKPLRFNWMTPILLSRHHQDIFYYGANRFYRSLNKGEKMEALSGDLTNGYVAGNVPYGTITNIAESPMKFGLLYAGTDDGNIHLSKDGGYTWTKISDKLPQKLWVTKIAPSKYKEGRLYVTLTGYRYDNFTPYLFVSEDYGASWQPLGKNLPMEPLNAVAEDPVNEHLLYVGADNGFYVSFDRGQSFMPGIKGLARVPVYDLAIQERDKEIVLGTHGRSIYIAKIGSMQQLTPEALKEEILVLDFEPPLLPAGGGGRRSGGGRFAVPAVTLEIPYYVAAAGEVTLQILNDKGVLAATRKDTVKTKGIQFFKYDLKIDQANVSAFNGATILRAGTYEAVMTLPNGKKVSKKFTLKVGEPAFQQFGEEEAEEEF
jgi:photosystem II stability/assembly factor-like uncharacterized protein